MTQGERIAQLREQTAKATRGICPAWIAAAVRHIARNCDIDCEYLNCEHNTQEQIDAVPQWDRYDDAPHIVRWNPDAAEKVLDLLALLLSKGRKDALDRLAIYSAALAVLDTLDGGAP